MRMPSRRSFISAAGIAATALDQPLWAVAAAKPVRITNVDIFPIEIPISRDELEAGKYARNTFYEVETDAGVRGCCFDRGTEFHLLERTIRPALVGQDLFAVERHLKAGLGQWGGLEHAIWDAIGKVAGQPVYRLLGGSKPRLKVYLTCVWKGNTDQSERAHPGPGGLGGQAEEGRLPRHEDPREPAESDGRCGRLRGDPRGGGPGFFNHGGPHGGSHRAVGLWHRAAGCPRAGKTQRAVAGRALRAGRLLLPARLAREVDIPVSGGERFQGLDAYRECLVQGTYDILQPDAVICGGISTVRKVAALAEAFRKPVTLHGAMALRLPGWVQASAAIGAEWQELAIVTPPFLPEEQWSPALKVLNGKTLFSIRDGYIDVPDAPGLGLDVNREAVREFRTPVSPQRAFYPQYPA